MISPHQFSPIIERNTPLPATRTEIFMTAVDGQKVAEIRVFQGEHEDTRLNTLVGEFLIEGFADVESGNPIVVRLDLDLNGILKVTATERRTGLARSVTIDNAMERFRRRERLDAIERLDAVFGDSEEPDAVKAVEAEPEEEMQPSLREAIGTARALLAKAQKVLPSANNDDATELAALLTDLKAALDRRSEQDIKRVSAELEDLVFYLEDR